MNNHAHAYAFKGWETSLNTVTALISQILKVYTHKATVTVFVE